MNGKQRMEDIFFILLNSINVRTIRKPIAAFMAVSLCVGFLSNSPLQAREAGKGTIEGRILTSDEEPAPSVTVHLQNTQYGAATNNNGRFRFQAPAGDYTLIISFVGMETIERTIQVSENQTLNIADVTLNVSARQLQEIVVEGKKVNKFSVSQSDYVAKLPIRNIENPQVYNTIPSALLEDQVVTGFDDALTNAPGVFKLWGSTGRGGDGAGYYSLRGFAVQPTMTNGLPSLSNGTPDPANIERIEVIKGPSGALFGSSLISYGGLINVVTKKPYPFFGGKVSYKVGSFGLNRVTADVNTPVGEEKNIAVRINGAYETKNSFQDAGFYKSVFIAPSLSYQVNNRLSFLINTEYYRSEGSNPTMVFLNRSSELEFKNLDELNYDPDHSYTSNDITISNPTFNLQGQMKYKLSGHWTSQTVLSRSSAKTDGYYTYLWDLAAYNGVFTRYVSKQNSTTLGTDIQQNFIGNFAVGGLQNKVVAGLDYLEKNVISNSTGYVGLGQVTMQETNPAGLSQSAADTALAHSSVANSKTKQNIYSAYVSDVINVIPRLSAMLSLRVDHFVNEGTVSSEDDDYNQTALSPKLGLVYQPVKEKLSLFANYMNGFRNVAPRVQDDGSTKSFSPERANQWEAGIKANLYHDRLSATVSYYDILVSDIVREDPARLNFYIQDGENYSRGVEASITAAPAEGLNLIAGYSHNVSKITKTDSDDYRGRRPEAAGPEDLVNGWVSYRISNGAVRGLGLGFGGNYASKNKTLNRASTGVFVLPAYTVLNASVFYDTSDYRIDFKVNNFTDKEYYKGWSTVNPQQPRNIMASFSYKF